MMKGGSFGCQSTGVVVTHAGREQTVVSYKGMEGKTRVQTGCEYLSKNRWKDPSECDSHKRLAK